MAAFANPILWEKSPRNLEFLCGRGLTPTDKAVWHVLNTASQIQARGGYMSLPEIARCVECARSTAAESVARLEAAGVLTAYRKSGKRTRYCTITYRGLQVATRPPGGPAPVRQPDGSSIAPAAGYTDGPASRAHAKTETYGDKPSTTAALPVTGISEPNPPVVVAADDLVNETAKALEERGYTPDMRILKIKLAGKTKNQVDRALWQFREVGKRKPVTVGLFVSILEGLPADVTWQPSVPRPQPTTFAEALRYTPHLEPDTRPETPPQPFDFRAELKARGVKFGPFQIWRYERFGPVISNSPPRSVHQLEVELAQFAEEGGKANG